MLTAAAPAARRAQAMRAPQDSAKMGMQQDGMAKPTP